MFHIRLVFHNISDEAIFREGTQTFRKRKKIARREIAFNFLKYTQLYLLNAKYFITAHRNQKLLLTVTQLGKLQRLKVLFQRIFQLVTH